MVEIKKLEKKGRAKRGETCRKIKKKEKKKQLWETGKRNWEGITDKKDTLEWKIKQARERNEQMKKTMKNELKLAKLWVRLAKFL